MGEAALPLAHDGAAVIGFEMLALGAGKVRWYRVLHALMGVGRVFLFCFLFFIFSLLYGGLYEFLQRTAEGLFSFGL